MVTVHNSSGLPQVVDAEGHVLGAGEFGQVSIDDSTQALIDAGVLTQIDTAKSSKKGT